MPWVLVTDVVRNLKQIAAFRDSCGLETEELYAAIDEVEQNGLPRTDSERDTKVRKVLKETVDFMTDLKRCMDLQI